MTANTDSLLPHKKIFPITTLSPLIIPKFRLIFACRYVRIANEILMYFRSQKKLASEISINETIDVDRDGNPLTYIDVVCCEEDISEEIDRKITTEKMLVYVEKLLSPRERQIIMMRYGLGGIKAQTQREIAQSLGISRSYVSRIEKSALSTLREALK